MATQSDTRLRDRHIIVTGGARGIGRGIAVRCAQAGADLSIFDTRPDVAAKTASLVRDEGGEAAVYEVDVTEEQGVEAAVDAATSELGSIDGLVNNAGVQQAIPLLETSEAEWDVHFDVNTKGTFFVSKTVAQKMVEDGTAGSIVNISSVGAERPYCGQGAYGASKAAVLALTTVLAKELSDHEITVNALKPGTVETPMVERWLSEHAEQSDTSSEEILSDALDDHILDRIGQPEEVGHVAVLLLSEEGEWMTGESIAVDGGYLKR